MITKTVFLITLRSGSHFLGELLTGMPGYNFALQAHRKEFTNFLGPDNKTFLATIPKYICPLYSTGNCDNKGDFAKKLLNTEDKYKMEAYITPVGGSIDNGESPEHVKAWTPSQIERWGKGLDLRVVHLLRDGRNQLASEKAVHTKPSAEKSIWTWEHFERRIEAFRERARLVLDRMKLDNFLLVKFEDLAIRTRPTLNIISSFTDIPFDIDEQIRCQLKLTPNSSYSSEYADQVEFKKYFNPVDLTTRWKRFSKQEREAIHRIAGQELIELGYINDNKWINE